MSDQLTCGLERERERDSGGMSGRRVSCAVGARLKWQKAQAGNCRRATTAAGVASAFGN